MKMFTPAGQTGKRHIGLSCEAQSYAWHWLWKKLA